MLFAILMGTARLIYGKFGEKLPLQKCIIASTLLCLASYLIISLSPLPALGLIGCGICGFSVGILWPGTFSMASAAMPAGGTAMFALLALGGDVGCSGGPTFVGLISSAAGDNLKTGILCAIIFPILMLGGTICLMRRRAQ
jgi:MFS family permease